MLMQGFSTGGLWAACVTSEHKNKENNRNLRTIWYYVALQVIWLRTPVLIYNSSFDCCEVQTYVPLPFCRNEWNIHVSINLTQLPTPASIFWFPCLLPVIKYRGILNAQQFILIVKDIQVSYSSSGVNETLKVLKQRTLSCCKNKWSIFQILQFSQ